MANQYLYTVPYKELSKWYIEQFLRQEVSGKFPMYSLRQILSPIRDRVSSNNYSVQIPLVAKIRFTDGKLFYRTGEKPKNDVFIAHKGDLLVSNINFEKGAFCLVEDDILACSTDYQPYKIINDKVVPKFLEICLRSNKFLENVAKAKPQGMKTRAKWDFIQTFKIPLPSIEEQQRILDEYEREIKYAEAIKQARLSAISDYFVKELLPYNYEVSSIKKLFGTISLKEIDRWDVWNQLTNVKSNKYQVVPFGKLIIGKPQYGANTPGVDKKSDFRYIRITDINENGTLNNDIVFPKDVEKQYILHEDDFLIARSGNTVGKTFLYKERFGDAIYAGYLVRYIINKQLANPEYLFFYSKTIMYQNWVKKNQRISGQPNINGQEYLAVPIILPDLEKQQEMVNMSKIIQQDVVSQVRQSEMLVGQAKQDFENAIFN